MNSLASELENCIESKFTGRLNILTYKGEYRIYFGLGKLVWATGGFHPNRRWRRSLRKACPELDLNQIKIRQTDEMDSWKYSALVILLQRGDITPEQFLTIATAYIQEVLFDLLQISMASESNLDAAGNNDDHLDYFQNQYDFKVIPHSGIRPAGNYILPRTLALKSVLTFAEAKQAWNFWVGVMGAKAVSISPNHVPVIKKPEILVPKLAPKAYENLSILASGNYTIRDIAEVLQKKSWEIMSIFMPHTRNGEIEFIEVPDLDSLVSLIVDTSNSEPTKNLITQKNLPETPRGARVSSFLETSISAPVVACIDDSQQHCEILGRTLRGLGYNFLPITNEVEALPQLITMVPNIIFLDLLMPIISGYELCAQIRRVSRLENVPVIILTGKNGIVDRVRAKMVGATDFVTKPVNPEQLLAILQKYSVLAQE